MGSDLIIDSLIEAKKSIKKLVNQIPKGLLCHQDQGSQYTSYEYVDAVLKSDLTLSYSTPATPTENPGQESFFGRFKEENQDEIDEIRDFKELEKFVAKRVNYYNRKRIHTSVGYQAPIKFTKQFINNFSLTENKKWFRFFRT